MSGDLFGEKPKMAAPKGSVTLELVCHDDRDKSWLLSKDGDRRKAAFVPKSLGTRGDGLEANLWTLPKWKAAELGWLS